MSEEEIIEKLKQMSEEDLEPLRNFIAMFGYDLDHFLNKKEINDNH